MQSDQQLFPENPVFPLRNAPNASAFDGTVLPADAKNPRPFLGLEFQPSEVCPKNFIIFDQTENRSQIVFHPVIAPKFCYPVLNIPSPYIHDNVRREAYTEDKLASFSGEDSNDIDALLSLEEEQEDSGEEEVSTARTHGNYESDSSESCSSYGSKPKKGRLPLSSQKSSGSGGSCNSEKKRQKMKKMVKALRGIVPGGDRMNTVAVLDEAVRYLKSLKVEVQKLGVSDLN